MPRVIEGKLDAGGLRFGVVASRFNSAIVDQLVSGCCDLLRRHGCEDDDITVVWAPGAFELPLLALELAETGTVDAVICLGVVIRGATDHYTYVAGQAAAGVADVARATRVPVIFGILTTDTIEQAVERAGTKAGNKGSDAAVSAIEAVDVLRSIRSLTKND
ncbi:MAG: 6,7-dimethyl-8-ribityllumazine synthase [Actinobacteria bacterium ATB1]|nr:6,7-dimethyl-8-ribityllumazine synthase [Actinobacteria bacterium ATB1]